MRKKHLLKKLAVLLSLSMSLGPCALCCFPVFAETGRVEKSVEIPGVEESGEESADINDDTEDSAQESAIGKGVAEESVLQEENESLEQNESTKEVRKGQEDLHRQSRIGKRKSY